jgi:hypothetical protein
MYLKNKLIAFLLIVIISFSIFPTDFTNIDNLYHDGKYQEGLNILLTMHDKNKPDPAVIWRICRMYYEIADLIPNKDKQKKINKFNEALDFTRPYLDLQTGDKLDRAQIVFWYAASLGSRGETIGIKESLDTVKDLFKLADKAISIDPTFAAPYLLKGRIDDAVPSFLGGDKFRMSINLTKGIELNPKDMNLLVDSAHAFIKRDWDVEKKRKNASKMNKTDGSPQNLSDREYAKQILNMAIKVYLEIKNPSKREMNKYNEAIRLLKKIS